MAPTSRIKRRQTDVGRSDGLEERQTRDASCSKSWLRFRCKKRSLDVDISLQGSSTDHNASDYPGPSGSDAEEGFEDESAASLEAAREPSSAGGLLKRSLGDLLGTDEDGTEDENGSRNHIDFDLSIPLSSPLSPLLSHPLPLPSLPPNPIAALLPQPPPPPAAPLATASHVPSSISIPPAASSTDGISENLGAPSPSTTNPPRSSFSAPRPKNTSAGDYSDDDGDDSDDDGYDGSSTSKPYSIRTRTTLTAIAPPYETQTPERSGERSTISRTTDAATSFTTSVIVPNQTARAKTGAHMTAVTSIASPSGTAAAVLGHNVGHGLSPAGEKAVIASTSIGGFIILLVVAWFLWRSAKRKSAGRKSAWPASRDMLGGPRRVSNKVADRFTSIKGHLSPGTFGWCSIDDSNDENGPVNEKPAPALALKKAGLLERRLGAKTPPQHVTVNSYGMVFRTPILGDSASDILERPRVTPPPTTGVARDKSRQMAAAHLESARASVSAYASRSQSLAPSRKNNNRISDVSSLSSGFGDGDIVIIQPPNITAATPNRSNAFDPNINLGAAVRTSPKRKSFGSRFSRNNSRDQSRDTVMTNSSEDLRPRFRTVSSWVHQQSRRTKKRYAANRSEDRGMTTPLPEQGFDMMMPDGEKPRRVESAMWAQK
ncbi:hypothetical protein ACQKWADRAFT_183815 [Trichoderma austrokoningii]